MSDSRSKSMPVAPQVDNVPPSWSTLCCWARFVCMALQVAIVTGAARGIGFAIAQSLGKEGAAVMVSDVDDTAAAAAVSNLQQQGISASFVHCDVANSDQVSGLAVIQSSAHHNTTPNSMSVLTGTISG